MKKFLFFLLLFVTAISCDYRKQYPKYELDVVKTVHHNDQLNVKNYSLELIRAVREHKKAGDFEDIDYTIQRAYDISYDHYAKKKIVLLKHYDYYVSEHIYYEDMTNEEKKIYNNLLNGITKNP